MPRTGSTLSETPAPPSGSDRPRHAELLRLLTITIWLIVVLLMVLFLFTQFAQDVGSTAGQQVTSPWTGSHRTGVTCCAVVP
jgi:hypothetical protein